MRALKTMIHSLDAWLWRRGIDHPVIRPLVRNEMLLTGIFLLGGGVAFTLTPWFFWFGVGVGIMTLTFWSLARFFLRSDLRRIQRRFFARGFVPLGRQTAVFGRPALCVPDCLHGSGFRHFGRLDRGRGSGAADIRTGFARRGRYGTRRT